MGKSPDPSNFTIVDDESASTSRAATPQPQSDIVNGSQEEQGNKENPGKEQSATGSEGGTEQRESTSEPKPMLQDLPAEVKARLRKLDKLESKYAELFKAYKAAHARVQAIEPFEASLRENTPLTSISDPSALSEYLDQVNMKNSMVVEELKRVSGERDEFKRKFETSEACSKNLEQDIQQLKSQFDAQASKHLEQTVAVTETKKDTNSETPSGTKEDTSPITSPKSTSSRLPSLSIFSPRSKPKDEMLKNESEDIFSFDSEVPKLEAELQEKKLQVDELSLQVTNLKADLRVARESTEGMVQTLERTTEELNSLRDAKDKYEAIERDLRERIAALESEQQQERTKKPENGENSNELKRELGLAQTLLKEAQDRIDLLETQNKDSHRELQDAKDEIENLNKSLSDSRGLNEMLDEKIQQKDNINKDLEDSLAFARKAEREHEQASRDLKASEKRIQTMQSIMDSLKLQLEKADLTVTELRSEAKKSRQELEEKSRDITVAQTPQTLAQEGTSNSSKKKNKKKKKGKGPLVSNAEPEPSETCEIAENHKDPNSLGESNEKHQETLNELTEKIDTLVAELDNKKMSIERLSAKIKDQEALQEEIETLRDDLLHQGEEHVEARDALKSMQSQRDSLQESVDRLRLELGNAQEQVRNGAEATEIHQKALAEFEELKAQHVETIESLEAEVAAHGKTMKDFKDLEKKADGLRAELNTTEQLATSRFKDITELKSILEQAQPEIRNLKKEVEELKSCKDDLKNKSGELSRLEQKHEEVKTELKNLGKRLSNQDTEIKELKTQIEKGARAKELVENELRTKESELRSAEARRINATEMQEQIAKELLQSKQENEILRTKSRDLTEQISNLEGHISSLREEVSLKAALHTSSQSLVQSLRDQMHELNTTTRELTARSESKEEELAEAQRMLSERTRESQTMRALLDQSESGTEARLRDMRERMEAAKEERDRLEDEYSVSSRRMARELNEAQNKLRDAQRALRTVENEKEDLEGRSREWRKLRGELEYASKSAEREAEEARQAMKGVREALDESETQIRDSEAQKADLRRQLEETSDRVERLNKANKNLTEEVKNLQAHTSLRRPGARPGGVDSGLQSSRTSIDSNAARAPLTSNNRLTTPSTSSLPRSETPGGNASSNTGLSQGTVDYVYLKNVLLQFLSQKDKAHQRQLIPVLGMLLHFDDRDQQRWNAAITAR